MAKSEAINKVEYKSIEIKGIEELKGFDGGNFITLYLADPENGELVSAVAFNEMARSIYKNLREGDIVDIEGTRGEREVYDPETMQNTLVDQVKIRKVFKS